MTMSHELLTTVHKTLANINHKFTRIVVSIVYANWIQRIFVYITTKTILLFIMFETFTSTVLDTVLSLLGSQQPQEYTQHRSLKDVVNYYNPNDTYTPTFAARYGSMLTPNTGLELNYDYFQTVIITIAAILASGLLSWLCFNCGVFFRCCCTCIRCLPHRPARRPNNHSRRARQHAHAQSQQQLVATSEEGQLEMQQIANNPAQNTVAHSSTNNADMSRTRTTTARSNTGKAKKRYPWTCGRYFLYFCLFLASIFALTADQFFLVGRQSVTDGLETAQSAVDDVQSLLGAAINQTVVLGDYAGDMLDEYDQAEITCPLLLLGPGISQEAKQTVEDFQTSVSDIDDLISPISSKFDTYQSKAENYYSDGAPFFVIWALTIITLFLVWLFVFCEKRSEAMYTLYIAGNFTFLILILLQAVVMFLTIVLGDLCGGSASDSDNSSNGLSSSSSLSSSSDQMSPTETILTLIPLSGDVLSTAQYFTTCVANASSSAISVDNYIHQAYGYTAELTASAKEGLQYCPNDVNLLSILTILGQVNSTLSTLQNTVSCPPIQQIWFSLVNDALCTELYSGIFYVWGAALLTSMFLIITMILLSIVYQYWLPFEKMLPPKAVYRRRVPSQRGQPGRTGNSEEEEDGEFLRMYSGNIDDYDSDEDYDSDYDGEDENDEARLEHLNAAAREFAEERDERETMRMSMEHIVPSTAV